MEKEKISHTKLIGADCGIISRNFRKLNLAFGELAQNGRSVESAAQK